MGITSNVWPVNEKNEIITETGTGTRNIVGFLPQDQIPVSNTGGMLISPETTRTKIVTANFSPVVRSSVGDSTDTNYVALATFSVPGGLLGPNGWLEIFCNASSSINTLTKTFAVYIGGSNIAAPTILSNQTSLGWSNYVFNTASELSQKCANIGSSPFGSTPSPNINLSVDTRANFDVVFKVKWSAQAAPAGADTITLNGYYIKAHYAP